MPVEGVLRLSKHHAAGNDFLVLMDLDDTRHFSVSEVRALCDRHHGVGADGLVRVLRGTGDAQFAMELRNADGSVAEMSGNGIRCLVQAVVESGAAREGTVSVGTMAGLRRVAFETRGRGAGWGVVEMGPADLGPDMSPDVSFDVQRARFVEMGNPHVVLLLSAVDDESVRSVGEKLERSIEGGTNVEFAWLVDQPDSVGVRVFERGVGETLACGTGACATAAALHDWGLVGRRVRVHMPGGVLEVHIEESTIVLEGPTRKIAEVSIAESDLAELVTGLEQVELVGEPSPGSRGEVVGTR